MQDFRHYKSNYERILVLGNAYVAYVHRGYFSPTKLVKTLGRALQCQIYQMLVSPCVIYGFEKCWITQRDEPTLRVFEWSIMRNIFSATCNNNADIRRPHFKSLLSDAKTDRRLRGNSLSLSAKPGPVLLTQIRTIRRSSISDVFFGASFIRNTFIVSN